MSNCLVLGAQCADFTWITKDQDSPIYLGIMPFIVSGRWKCWGAN